MPSSPASIQHSVGLAGQSHKSSDVRRVILNYCQLYIMACRAAVPISGILGALNTRLSPQCAALWTGNAIHRKSHPIPNSTPVTVAQINQDSQVIILHIADSSLSRC